MVIFHSYVSLPEGTCPVWLLNAEFSGPLWAHALRKCMQIIATTLPDDDIKEHFHCGFEHILPSANLT